MFSKCLISLLAIANFASTTLGGPVTNAKVINAGGESTIPGHYIVVYKPGITDAAADAHTNRINSFQANMGKRGIKDKWKFSKTGFRGYSGEFNDDTLAEILKSPEVNYVEQDAVVNVKAEILDKRDYLANSTWGLDRISHTASGEPWAYYYDSVAESPNITAYVVDTGIRVTHEKFLDYITGETRAFWGTNTIDSLDTDGNGHGTHCAGTIGAETYGVNRRVKLVAVKVLDSNGDGTLSSVISGVGWVVANAIPNLSVMNMSLGSPKSTSMNDAVESAVSAGITVVVAAGNDGVNAKNSSPASAPNVITVGAIDKQWWAATNKYTFPIASFSNYGTTLDIFAPGVDVVSTWATSDNATEYLDGTSMAAPHVAGLAVYFMGMAGPSGLSPASVLNEINSNAVTGQITGNLHSSPNRIAFNDYCTTGAGCAT
ncbi:hypothetical protein TWF694_007796 [Orbilia ellipsospora]|uniref:Uncharacterized protein n=1 Tax=Orbilia ellipsospora TaxID=2528407 RepID=A0AAV9XJS2_9PEZI